MPDHQYPVPQGPYYNNQNYILVIDHYSSCVFLYKLQGRTSHDVIKTLMRMFAEYNSSATLYSDSRPQFDSRDFAHFAVNFEFLHNTSSLLHSWSNGIVEQQVCSVKDLLKRSSSTAAFFKGFCSLRSMPLDAHLPLPAEMLFGRKVDTAAAHV